MSGQVADPRQGCGVCTKASEMYAEIYPSWAQPEDIKRAEIDGLDKKFLEQRKRYQVCPFDQKVHLQKCSAKDQYWNELACECFTFTTCKMECQQGEEFDPLANCQCKDSKAIWKEVYPSWATELDIKFAEDASKDRYYYFQS